MRQQRHQKMVIVLMVIVGWQVGCYDCVWNKERKEIEESTIRPYQSCLDYCSQMFSQLPQRSYYNITSQNCQPLRKCVLLSDNYDYATNKCYKDKQNKKIAKDYVPELLINYQILSNNLQICVNGVVRYEASTQKYSCECNMLWQDSGELDMNGIAFRCDRVVEDVERYFYDELKVNKEGQVVRYGPYSSEQLQIVLNELGQVQEQQIQQYVYSQIEPILFSVYNYCEKEDLFVQGQWWLVLLILICVMIAGITYFDYQEYEILVEEWELKQMVEEVLGGFQKQ